MTLVMLSLFIYSSIHLSLHFLPLVWGHVGVAAVQTSLSTTFSTPDEICILSIVSCLSINWLLISTLQMSEHLSPSVEPGHPTVETHFSHYYLHSRSFSHDPKLSTIGEGRSVDRRPHYCINLMSCSVLPPTHEQEWIVPCELRVSILICTAYGNTILQRQKPQEEQQRRGQTCNKRLCTYVKIAKLQYGISGR